MRPQYSNTVVDRHVTSIRTGRAFSLIFRLFTILQPKYIIISLYTDECDTVDKRCYSPDKQLSRGVDWVVCYYARRRCVGWRHTCCIHSNQHNSRHLRSAVITSVGSSISSSSSSDTWLTAKVATPTATSTQRRRLLPFCAARTAW